MIFYPVFPDIRESIALFEGFQASPASPSCEMKMSMKHWWNDTDKGNPTYWEQSPSQGLTQEEFHLPKYIRFHFLPHSKHITSTLQEQLVYVLRDKIAVYCGNDEKQINTAHAQDGEFILMLKYVVHIITTVS